ncbi:uncharacterized protein LOC106164487 [Lingula anatina]|uniref:Uncharacterized protein LOC106164487 n=1 Tax=Lingula anatina TaxID=7574 RepID=A0A1S3IIC1_LINAN|nr:uncharacterized protein LOC106164487 [Lingula anatina]|eukprot:XP_013397873.1 uncharacterized protein LOC106164487 [Lingula anatina]
MIAVSALLLLGVFVLQASACTYFCPQVLVLRGYVNDKGEFVEDKSFTYCPDKMDFIIKGYVEGSSIVSEEPQKRGSVKTVEYTVRVDQVFKAPASVTVGSTVIFPEKYREDPLLPSCGEVKLTKDATYLLRGVKTQSGFKLANMCDFGKEWKYVPELEKKYLTTEGCK